MEPQRTIRKWMALIGGGSFIVETLKEKGGVIQIPYSSMDIESRISAE